MVAACAPVTAEYSKLAAVLGDRDGGGCRLGHGQRKQVRLHLHAEAHGGFREAVIAGGPVLDHT